MDTNPNEINEIGFNSALLDDETLFSSHTINTLPPIDLDISIN